MWIASFRNGTLILLHPKVSNRWPTDSSLSWISDDGDITVSCSHTTQSSLLTYGVHEQWGQKTNPNWNKNFTKMFKHIVTCMSVALHGVGIGNRIYCTYKTRYCTSQITIGYTRSSQSVTFFPSRYLVAVQNGRRPAFSGFLKYPRPQLPASHSNSSQWLNLSSPLTDSLTRH
jgi:hypothetical protein